MKPEFAKELTSGAHAILLLQKFCREISLYGTSVYTPVTANDTSYQVRSLRTLPLPSTPLPSPLAPASASPLSPLPLTLYCHNTEPDCTTVPARSVRRARQPAALRDPLPRLDHGGAGVAGAERRARDQHLLRGRQQDPGPPSGPIREAHPHPPRDQDPQPHGETLQTPPQRRSSDPINNEGQY
eukprot:1184937-Prorocentrum_minimum.AAC.1